MSGSISSAPDPQRIIGSLHFLDDGILDFTVSDNPLIQDIDKSMFMLAAEFSAYAFDRSDWMEEFLIDHAKKLSKTNEGLSEDNETNKVHLKLLQGGLENNEED